MDDKQLSKTFGDYQQLAKQNPNIDLNLLMTSALSSQVNRQPQAKSYRWAYFISLGLPPFGLFFAVKYYLSGDEADHSAANICVGLTIVSILLFIGLSKLLFAGSGVDLNQIQQIKPNGIGQLAQ